MKPTNSTPAKEADGGCRGHVIHGSYGPHVGKRILLGPNSSRHMLMNIGPINPIEAKLLEVSGNGNWIKLQFSSEKIFWRRSLDYDLLDVLE